LAEAPDKQEHKITMIGFSAAAAGLVSIVDKSPLFLDAALTAPVSLDPVEKVERFTLQFKVALPGLAQRPSQ
jgi:general secretion pathway protein L